MTFERFESYHLVTVNNRNESVCGSCHNIAMFSIYVDCCTLTHMTIHLSIIWLLFSNISFILKCPRFFIVDNHIHSSNAICDWLPRFRNTSFGCDKQTCWVHSPANFVSLQIILVCQMNNRRSILIVPYSRICPIWSINNINGSFLCSSTRLSTYIVFNSNKLSIRRPWQEIGVSCKLDCQHRIYLSFYI